MSPHHESAPTPSPGTFAPRFSCGIVRGCHRNFFSPAPRIPDQGVVGERQIRREVLRVGPEAAKWLRREGPPQPCDAKVLQVEADHTGVEKGSVASHAFFLFFLTEPDICCLSGISSGSEPPETRHNVIVSA